MKRKFISYMLIIAAGLASCTDVPDKSAPPPPPPGQELTVKHYGTALFSSTGLPVEQLLDSLSADFKLFIGDNPDTLQLIQIREFISDPFNRSLAEKCREVFPEGTFPQKDLEMAFRRIYQVYPGFTYPVVYTYISGLLYEYPVYYADSTLVIALDMFLGRDFEAYRAAGIPMYMSRRMEPASLVPECARDIIFSWFPADYRPATLLDHMLMHGKALYALDLVLPGVPDSLKIGYTGRQMEWCEENQASLWRLFIDQELLYKTGQHLVSRFIQDGPFTPGLPGESPAMTGRWTGWQIIRSYMEKNPSVSIPELFLDGDSQAILSASGYKPRK